jgi:uncharacterized DUF497 family protein
MDIEKGDFVWDPMKEKADRIKHRVDFVLAAQDHWSWILEKGEEVL